MEYSSQLKKISLLISLSIFFSIPKEAKSESDIPIFQLEIRNHLFFPDRLTIPANTRVQLVVTNHDATPEEFESFELNREKVIMGNSKATIYIGPLKSGTYPFFGEFYPETAQGQVLAK